MPALAIKYLPAEQSANWSWPARYVAAGFENQAIVADDPVLTFAQLQAALTGLEAAVASIAPGSTLDLAARKRVVIDKIDRRTAELFAAGYTHSNGVTVALDPPAQLRYHNVLSLLTMATAIVVESIDGLASFTINTGLLGLGDAQTFARAATNYAHAISNVGNTLKNSARAAASVAALEAIVDNR